MKRIKENQCVPILTFPPVVLTIVNSFPAVIVAISSSKPVAVKIQKIKLTLKAPITTAADDKFWDIFPNLRKKSGMIFHENRLPADNSHEISWLICCFWKHGKIWNCRLLQIIGLIQTKTTTGEEGVQVKEFKHVARKRFILMTSHSSKQFNVHNLFIIEPGQIFSFPTGSSYGHMWSTYYSCFVNQSLMKIEMKTQGWDQSAILNQENMSVDSKMEKSNF